MTGGGGGVGGAADSLAAHMHSTHASSTGASMASAGASMGGAGAASAAGSAASATVFSDDDGPAIARMRRILLWTHDPPNFSQHDFVLSPAFMPPHVSHTELLMLMDTSTYDALERARAQGKDTWLDVTRTLLFTPQQALADTALIERQHQLQLSVSRSIASLCGLSNRVNAVLMRTARERHTITHMELYFKDMYMTRGDMWRMTLQHMDSCVYVGQTITTATGWRVKVGRLFVHEHSVLSGYIDTTTKHIYRSESAWCTIFVQMSDEMWSFDESGELYYEKVLHGFLPDLVRKWKVIGTNHVVSIVLFTRVLYDEAEREHLEGVPLQRMSCGQLYADFYKVVLNLDTNTHWPCVMHTLKEEFYRFQHDILLQPRHVSAQGIAPPAPSDGNVDGSDPAAFNGRVLVGRFAPAYQGNFLEAINMQLNSSDHLYIDRDLTRTGCSVIVLTAGTGHFHANKHLLRLTTQRMFDRATSMDLVCLTQMPLHTVPIFQYTSAEPPATSAAAAKYATRDPLFYDPPAGTPLRTFYAVPFWINCSFYNIDQDRMHWRSKFVPRCRMDDIRMIELLGARQQKLTLPYMSLSSVHGPLARHVREQYDRDRFADSTSMPSTLPTTPPPGGMAPQDVWVHKAAPTPPPPSHAAVGMGLAEGPTPRTCASDSSSTYVKKVWAAGVGKAAPIVGETTTTMLAVRTPNAQPAHLFNVAHAARAAVWRALSWPWAHTRMAQRGATASDATRALDAALRKQDRCDAALVVHSTAAASHTVTDEADAVVDETRSPAALSMTPSPTAALSPDALYSANPINARVAQWSRNAMLLRWQHVFLERTSQHTVKWWSMSSPACLPVTTRYLPSEEELAVAWHEYPYTVAVHSDRSSVLLKNSAVSSPALAMLCEMCTQRLLQGFQLVERHVTIPGVAPPHNVVVRYPAELLQPGNFAHGEPIYMSAMNQVHRITYNRQAGTVHVVRYVHKMPYSTAPMPYRCCVWPRAQAGYCVTHTRFKYPDPHEYNWTYLDSLVAGYEDTLTESLHYWRARFVVVPSEHAPSQIMASAGEYLSDEEVRLAGMDRLADMFARAEFRPRSEPRHLSAPLRFLPTTLDPASSLCDDAFVQAIVDMHADMSRSSTHEAPRAPARNAASLSLAELADEMRAARTELKIYTRRWHNVRYADTFTGADLVTWLCRTYKDVCTREDAVHLASRLQEAGLIVHVLNVHGFMDGHYFYRLTPREESPARASRAALSHVGEIPPRGSVPRRRVSLSRSMLIDVDPDKRSARSEVAILHHDIVHNAENGFNFQIQWLSATAYLVEDLVQSWMRTVERYGLRLVEAPTAQVKDVAQRNLFEAPLPVHLAVPPPTRNMYAPLLARIRRNMSVVHAHEAHIDTTDSMEAWLIRHVFAQDAEHVEHLFETALVRAFGFVLDQEAHTRYPPHLEVHSLSRPNTFDYTQYVHRSGVAFVQVVGGRAGYLWLDNRLFNTRTHVSRGMGGGVKSKRAPPPDVDHIRRAFRRMCTNTAELAAFYERVWNILRRIDQTEHT